VVNRHVPQVTVSNVTRLSTEVGTTTRVKLAVDHDGPATLPRRWFVKLPSHSWRARTITALPRLLHTEVRFYNEVAAQVPIAYPAALAAYAQWGRGTTLVLEDVTETGAVPGVPGEALTAEQAGAVVDMLARLHATFWDHGRLNQTYPWLDGPIRRLEDRLGALFAVPLMRRGLRQAGTVVPVCLHAPALAYARHRQHAMRVVSAGPRTLIHHDCHAGNLYWRGAEPGLLDWQLVRVGEGIGDLAYLLATALDPDTRRLHEADLLVRYRHSLSDYGAPSLDPDYLQQRYRVHLIYPFEAMIVTLAVGGLIEGHVITELVRRAALAMQDHDAFAALA
jgi:hypothetical protein